MRKLALVAVLFSCSIPTGVLAQQPAAPQRSGTPEEQKACAHDVQKFCRPLMDQSDLVILGCLQQNRPKLTQACNQVLINHGQ